jgi:spoIIIJ-associated protein
MLKQLGFEFQLAEEICGESLKLNITSPDSARLIGREGHTLDDLQYLLNRILFRQEESAPRVVVDVEGYRTREQNHFLSRVKQVADRVRQTGQPEKLEPMNSYDRRLVHQAFAQDPDIRTISDEGDARFKQITLAPRKE